jgi:D-glycero-D-manno-heptose 1,7-bisphosphate phosphatase
VSWELETAFVDRDGTINVDATEGDYIRSWELFEFLPRAKEAIRLLNDLGLRVVLVTNQRGIALGRMTAEAVDEIHRRMAQELAGAGATIDGFYLCPHDKGECDCRKPGTGLFQQAKCDFPQIDFGRSVMIGNTWIDMEAGRRVGARTIYVDEGREDPGEVDLVVPSLWEGASRLAERIAPRPGARERGASTGPPRAPGALWDR